MGLALLIVAVVGLATRIEAAEKDPRTAGSCTEFSNAFAPILWEISNHPNKARRMKQQHAVSIIQHGYAGKTPLTDAALSSALPAIYAVQRTEEEIAAILRQTCADISKRRL